MPNFDGGHYFLTALIPIKSAEYVEQDGRKNSPVHMVRNALAVLPKARQSPVTEQTGFNSPFARNTRTHFARLFVIDDVINNGRNPVNALKVAIGSRLGQASAVRLNPTTQQPYDQLSQPYLVFVADFDASSGDDGALKSYLRELWQTMREELCSILKYCEGFDCKRASAETFYEYVKSCQVETTMSFNDYEYRLDTPGLRSISIPLLVAWAAAAALAALAGLLGTLIAVIRAWPDFDTLTILWIVSRFLVWCCSTFCTTTCSAAAGGRSRRCRIRICHPFSRRFIFSDASRSSQSIPRAWMRHLSMPVLPSSLSTTNRTTSWPAHKCRA